MSPQILFFYMFSFFLVSASLGVIFSRKTVHSVLCLILCFFNAASLFLLLNAEMIAFILLIVYIGAVAVLFLFVVMMLEDNIAKHAGQSYFKTGMIIASVLAIEVFASAWIGWHRAAPKESVIPEGVTHNVKELGKVLYTHYFYPFQLAGFVLLVAMIGAIVLTQRHSKEIKRQNIAKQIYQSGKESVSNVDVPFRKGVDIRR